MVSNLIANAIHYTPNGGEVLVSLTVRDRLAFITVKDTGIGISATEQPRIFDRFYRVERDRSRKTGGTGLGLAIAQAIAIQHQSYIKVESQVNQGSLFTVELSITSRSIAVIESPKPNLQNYPTHTMENLPK